ncbi:MAG: glutamine-hydrolyzing carbamoyl-phosphate synthase small subunit [Verrucomicrobiota bacterium]
MLALEDGRVFSGGPFGAENTTVVGEACFNTSMTGYQEVITDPSYHGQIISMTYPMIGNYGVNSLDGESPCPQIRGFLCEELCEVPSNWRSTEGLNDYLCRYGIPGLQGLDTRALVKHLREIGSMRATLTTDPSVSPDEAVDLARQAAPMEGSDFVHEVTTKEPYEWKNSPIETREWTLAHASRSEQVSLPSGDWVKPLPPVKYTLVAYDFGVKRNILRQLRQHGFAIEVVPADTPAEAVLERKPDGVFLSNGPGDPAALPAIHQNVTQLIGKVPLFAICMGHQLLGHAFGGSTFKLKFGHRGGNQPVQDLRDGTVAITSQNHGFAVDKDSLGDAIEVTHVNLNDGTVEGMRHKEYPIFSVQYHPEAAPGPSDARSFFQEFADLVASS